MASYISLPGSAEATNALRLVACPYEVADCDRYCASIVPGERPCDSVATGIVDRELFGETLKAGQRSAVFASSSSLVANHYRGHEVHFFYVHTGEEIGRVEVPVWVAEDERLLDLVHSLILDQCSRGPGYPVVLMEAHEQAVISAGDRRVFRRMLTDSLERQGLSAATSQKDRSKRSPWV